MARMTDSNIIDDTRNFIANGLKIRLTPGNPQPVRNIALSFQNAISQIPDDIISHLIDQPNDKLIVYTRKPQTDEHTNASNEANRRRHTS